MAQRMRSRIFVISMLLVASCASEIAAPAPHDDEPVGVAAFALSASDCPAGYTIISGTSGADTLTGTAGNDCILGLGGNDTIRGGGGNDMLIGGNGDDKLYGEAGQDLLYGEAGADTLEGGDDNDTAYGGTGVDTIRGGAGNDLLDGQDNGDFIYGDDGDDTLFGSAAADTVEGGNGRDVIDGGDGDDILRGGQDDDHIKGGANIDTIYGDAGDDVIDGGIGADKIWGGIGDDAIYGGDGNDQINGDGGDDALIGGLGSNTVDGGIGTDACSGTNCEKPQLTVSGCTTDSQCAQYTTCIVDIGLCLGCVADQDNDHVCDSHDACPSDPAKSAAGVCGCGVADTDSDADGTPNCTDACPSDALKTAAGVCGCGVADTDSDADGAPNCTDACPSDALKIAEGVCGCGVADTDSDADGTPNCNDACPGDALKTAAGACGCGVGDGDSDSDGTPDCNDGCPSDPLKTAAGACGCGLADDDADGDGVPDCHDICPAGDDHLDSDGDVLADACDICPADPWNDADGDGACGDVDRCPLADDRLDADADGQPDACDPCPNDPRDDGDGDGSCDSADTCPGGDDTADADGDGVCDALDMCATADDRQDDNGDGVIDHCEILRPVSLVGAATSFWGIADFDHDQKLDLLGTRSNYLNEGGFEFSASPAGGPCYGSPIADFDGDGHFDSVGSSAISDSTGYHSGFFLCYADAAGVPQPFALLNPYAAAQVYPLDVDGDGKLEVVITDDTQIQVYKFAVAPARGVASVQTLPANRTSFISYRVLAPDLDADGTPELLVRDWDGQLRIYRRDGSGQLQLDVLEQTRGHEMDIADVDGDGRLDMLTFGRENWSIPVILLYLGADPSAPNPEPGSFGNAHYRFGPPIEYNRPASLGYELSGFGLADLAGSKASEIVLQSPSGLHVVSYRRSTGFTALQTVPSEGEVSFNRLFGDLNGDGRLDVVQRLGESGRVLANVSCRTGVGADADGDQIPDACDACVGAYHDADRDGVCDAADSCASGDDTRDADHDGAPDACDVCPNDRNNDSDGDGSCDSQDPCPKGVNALDADGDSICDAMDICPNSDDNLDANYDGMPDDCMALSQEPLPSPLPTASGAIASGDLNGDAMEDLVYRTENGVDTYLGLGDGSFELHDSQTSSAYDPRDVVLRDLDHDGHLDAVLGSGNYDAVRVAYGDGTGSLALGQQLTAAIAGGILVGQLTGDDDLDIVTINNYSGGLKVWVSGGQRDSFANVFTDPTVYSATVGDFNGDGMDEIVGYRQSGYFHVVRRTDGTLYSEDLQASADNSYWLIPQSFGVTDVDGDGRAELLINYISTDSNYPAPATRVYTFVRPEELRVAYTNAGYGLLVGRDLTLRVRLDLNMYGLTPPQGPLWTNVLGDLRAELITVESSGGTLGLGVSGMTAGPYVLFRKLQFIPVQNFSRVIDIDLEGDGRRELLVQTYYTDSLLIRSSTP